MNPFEDDSIEVLKPLASGKRQKERRFKWKIAIPLAMAVAVAVVVVLFTTQDGKKNVPLENPVQISSAIPCLRDSTLAVPHAFSDSIDDVVFTVINLDGFQAKVSFEQPDSLDGHVVFAAPAADYRADNGRIVGEFIHDGKSLSQGVRKPGYCCVSPDGRVSIGMGDGDESKQTAKTQGGTFFRQYALVMDGEIQPNILRGKAHRRALGFLDGKVMAVVSANRESMFDFSQALADYGFSHAIYLPGGDSYIQMNTDRGRVSSKKWSPSSTFANYIIFSK